MSELDVALKSVIRSLQALVRVALREELAAWQPPRPMPPLPPPPKDWLTENDVAAYLGLRRSTLQGWRYQGRGPSWWKFGKTVRYRADAVEYWALHGTNPPKTEIKQRRR